MSEQNHGSQTQNPGLRSEQKHGSQTQNPGQRSEQNHGSQTQNPAQSRDRSQVHTRKKGYLRRGEKRQHLFTRPISLASLEEKAGGKHGTLFLFFGVILPVIAVAFELTTHFCAQHFFDPFPSSNHVILFLLIPLSNFMAWLAGRRDMSAHFGFMSLISGMAMGIGCLYALMFLPLTPHAALWTLVFGFGLLGFAPLLSVPCTWLSGKTVCKLAASRKTFFDAHQVEHIGHLIVLCLVVAVELPSTLTRMNLSLAADPATEKQGVQWLRQFGSEEVMLRACYERSGRATDILGSLYEAAHPVSIESARTIFYEVTGKPFNSVPIPAAARATIQHAGLIDDPNGLNADVKDEFDLDSDIAGENVSGVARGLAVSKTEVRGTVDSDAAVAELDWNTTFTNSSPYDREARAKLLLPPGGVVTKASVTINGVEHDATILVRSLARAIYRQAVAERRKDPLLVSTCGVNQVLIQCYPVQPNAETVVRLKIAAPLILSNDKSKAKLILPSFEERNFQFEQPVGVSLDATGAILPPVAQFQNSEQPKNIAHFHSAFSLQPAQLARFGSAIELDRNSRINKVISKVDGADIESSAISPIYKMPEKLTVVIDGSNSMARYLPELGKALKALPDSIKADVVIVGDDVKLLGDNSNPDSYATALGALEKFQAVGGHSDDNQLLNRIATTPVLWIHGAQPINTNNSKLLSDLLARPTNTPWLYDVQTVSGPNELLSGLEPSQNFVSVPRTGNLQDDLKRLFDSWKVQAPGGPASLYVDWNGNAAGNVAPNSATSNGTTPSSLTSNQPGVEFRSAPVPGLRSLYGYDKLLKSYQSSDKTPALMLAEKYHLVSPVSSAVVLEYVPDAHPSPIDQSANTKVGAKSAVNSPIDLLQQSAKKQIDKASFQVTSQLNNLSMAASDEKLRESQDAAKPAESTTGGAASEEGHAQSDDRVPPLTGTTNGTIGPDIYGTYPGSGSVNKEFEQKDTLKNEVSQEPERQLAAKSLRMEPLVKSPVSSSGATETCAPPPVTALPPPPVPASAPMWPAQNPYAPPSNQPIQMEAPQKPGALVDGAPQAPSGPSEGGLWHMFDSDRSAEYQAKSSIGVCRDDEYTSFSQAKAAIGIFALVFMFIYAFFKLMRAILRSRSN